MSDLVDLMTAARGAVYRALSAGAAGQLAQVFTEVPQDVQPDYFAIGAIHSMNVGAKPYDQREELSVEVWAFYRGEDRGVLLRMMHAARSDLDRQPIAAPDAALRPPLYVGGLASDADPKDGVTFAGLLDFKILAQPA